MRVNGGHFEAFAADGILAGPRNDIDATRIFTDDGISDTMRGGQDPGVTDDTAAAELGAPRLRHTRPDHGDLPQVVLNGHENAADNASPWRMTIQFPEGLQRFWCHLLERFEAPRWGRGRTPHFRVNWLTGMLLRIACRGQAQQQAQGKTNRGGNGDTCHGFLPWSHEQT
jgi:hypothetical protein